MLSEIRQKKTNTIRSNLHVDLKNKQTHRKRRQICGFQRWGWGRLDEGGQKVQTFEEEALGM